MKHRPFVLTVWLIFWTPFGAPLSVLLQKFIFKSKRLQLDSLGIREIAKTVLKEA